MIRILVNIPMTNKLNTKKLKGQMPIIKVVPFLFYLMSDMKN